MSSFGIKLLAVLLAIVATAAVAQEKPASPILFTNVNIFDGKNKALIEDATVVVTGNLITAISTEPLAVADGQVIDGGGRTLMPGLIDAHWHMLLAATKGNSWQTEQPDYSHARMVVESGRLLQRGFTTVRDIAGPGFGIKKAIDEGLIEGPRIYPSGAMISQTSGHADRTQLFEEPRVFSGAVEGAYADIILVDGNPLKDITLLGDNGNHIPFVMKDGVVYKNRLEADSSSASAEPARRVGVPFYRGMPASGQAAPPAPRTDATDFDRFVAEVGVDASAIGGKNGRSPARAASSAPPTEHADSSDLERFVAAVGADAATIGDELERVGKLDPMGAELMAMIFCPMHLRMESRGAPLDPFDPFASVASQIDQRLIEVSQPASGRADKPDPSRQD